MEVERSKAVPSLRQAWVRTRPLWSFRKGKGRTFDGLCFLIVAGEDPPLGVEVEQGFGQHLQ